MQHQTHAPDAAYTLDGICYEVSREFTGAAALRDLLQREILAAANRRQPVDRAVSL